jgi:hypothetical protein
MSKDDGRVVSNFIVQALEIKILLFMEMDFEQEASVMCRI